MLAEAQTCEGSPGSCVRPAAMRDGASRASRVWRDRCFSALPDVTCPATGRQGIHLPRFMEGKSEAVEVPVPGPDRKAVLSPAGAAETLPRLLPQEAAALWSVGR